jgi:HSP20 family protein
MQSSDRTGLLRYSGTGISSPALKIHFIIKTLFLHRKTDMDQKLPIHKYFEQPVSSLFTPFWWNDDSVFGAAQRNMNRMMTDVLDSWQMAMPGMAHRLPAADVTEDNKSFRVKMPMPGLEADDIDISTADGMLTISAEKTEKKNGAESSYSFTQSMSLPEGVDIGRADVNLSHHLLTIEIPKTNGKSQKLEIRSGDQRGSQKQKPQQQQK